MFPNLRLMLSASVATIALVAIVGSSLVMFRPPPARMVDDNLRPSASVADDIRAVQNFDTAVRRSEELQRLLSLPSNPVHAYAPEPAATFPYEVKSAPAGDVASAANLAAPTPPANTMPAPEPVAAAPAMPPPLPTAAKPETEDTTATVVAAAPEPVRTLQAEPPPVAAPEAVPAAAPIAEPSATVTAMAEPAPPVTASPMAVPTPDVPAEVTATVAAPLGPVPMAPVNPSAPAADVEIFPVSSIPAVEDAPLPRPKPQIALADPKPTSEPTDPAPKIKAKAASPRLLHVKLRTKVRPHATLSRRIKRPLPAPTAFESQQGQVPVSNTDAIRDGSAGSPQGNWAFGTWQPGTGQPSASPKATSSRATSSQANWTQGGWSQGTSPQGNRSQATSSQGLWPQSPATGLQTGGDRQPRRAYAIRPPTASAQ